MKRAVLLVMAILIAASCAVAGTMTMARVWDVVRDERGNVVSGATVMILESDTGESAALYADQAGAMRVVNPLRTDRRGVYEAFVLPGIYDVQIERRGYETTSKIQYHYVAYQPSLVAPSDLAARQASITVEMDWTGGLAPFYTAYKRAESDAWKAIRPYSGSYSAVAHMIPQDDGYGNHSPLDYAFFYDDVSRRFRIIHIRDVSYTATHYLGDGATQHYLRVVPKGRFGHSSSADLVTWEHHPPLMAQTHLSNNNMVIAGGDTNYLHMVWAPHVLKHGDKWRMFYTGVDRQFGMDRADTTLAPWANTHQRIFYAEMDVGLNIENPANWTNLKILTDGVTTGSPWTAYDGLSGPTVNNPAVNWSSACRDPYVLEHGDTWYMYYTAIDSVWYDGSPSRSVLGVATAVSVDGPYTPLGFIASTPYMIGKSDLIGGGPESVQVHWAEHAQKWYMLFHGAPPSGAGHTSFLLWATADHPLGPWTYDGATDSLVPYTGYNATDITIPAMVAGPMGVHFDTFPASGAGLDSWILGTTRHGLGATAARISLHSMYIPRGSARPTMQPGWCILTTTTGPIVLNEYIDASVYPGISYSYRVAPGYYPTYSNIATVDVSHRVGAEFLDMYYAYSGLRSFIQITTPGQFPWRYRYRAVLNVVSQDAQSAIFAANPEWSEWTTGPANGTAALTHCHDAGGPPSTVCDLQAGEYCHIQVQVRATQSPEQEPDGYDVNLFYTYENDDELNPVSGPVDPGGVIDMIYASVDSVVAVPSGQNINLQWSAQVSPGHSVFKSRFRVKHDGSWTPASWDDASVQYHESLGEGWRHYGRITDMLTSDLVTAVDSIMIQLATGVAWVDSLEAGGLYRRYSPPLPNPWNPIFEEY